MAECCQNVCSLLLKVDNAFSAMIESSTTAKTGRYSGRMQRSSFWGRIIPVNILFNICDRLITVYYTERIEAADKLYLVEQGGELILPEEHLDDAISTIYGEILPYAGLSAFILLIYVIVVSPWYVRRLHDIGMSGRWYLVWLVPAVLQVALILVMPILPEVVIYGVNGMIVLAGVFLLVCSLIDSRREANRYGESPKYGRYKHPAVVLPPVPSAEKES